MEFFSKHSEIIGVLMMPITYGFVGWFTNWVALKMTFYPLNFWGIPPFLGWQGIIPRKAHKMASKAVDVITLKLLRIEEIFQKIDPEGIDRELRPLIKTTLKTLTGDIAMEINPTVWSMMSDGMKERVVAEADKKIPDVFTKIVKEINKDVTRYFDLKALVLKNLTGPNTSLIVEMFQKVGAPEFRFIEISGLYFGLLLGGIQMGIWYLYPQWWTLPIQGIIVGYLTNWLALEMIFRPLEERSFLGFKYQGLFLKRQTEVSAEYAHLVATRILNARNVLQEILYGRAAEQVYEIIKLAIIESLENTATAAHPVISVSIGSDKYNSLKKMIIERLLSLTPQSIEKIEKYVDEAMELEITMSTRMAKLPAPEFENILRSAFQEDELLLILIGAALGAVVGLAQGLYMIM